MVLAALYERLGQPVGVFGLAAVLVGAFAFGVTGAMVSATVQTLLNTAVMQLVITPPVSFSAQAFVGIGAYFLLGAAVGNQRNLSRRLGEELTRNELLRVREQETLAAIPDAMIRVALDGNCYLQGVQTPDSLEQVTERALGRSLSQERHATIHECIARVRATGQEQELTFESPGASSHDLRFLPAADASVLIVVRNITEQRKLLRRVTAAENLASLGTLSAGLAHEINNPLTYVITSLSAAGQALPAGISSAKAEIGAALEGCWRIRDIVRSILQTTHGTQESVEAVHIPEVIDAALALVRSQVRLHAAIVWHPEAVPYAMAHRTKLVQVIVNLVVNASQAFEDSHTSAHEIVLRAYGEASQVVVEVRDNGPGMPDAVKSRALEPFFTTKEPGRGTGLGLFLCNSIIESLGGSLSIDSHLGYGTTITLRLPEADAPPESRVVCRSMSSTLSEPPAHIRTLVVDDEPEIRRALCRVLSRSCAVTVCENGLEALQSFRNGERYDVIICDLLMPEMTGMELHSALVRDYPAQAERLLFLTGGATSESTRTFLSKHANRVVNKPFKPAELEAAVRMMARFPMPIAPPSMRPGA